MVDKLDAQVILDGLGHGVLIFDDEGRLVQHNRMAGTILGTDLNVIRSEGWAVAVGLFDTGLQQPEEQLEAVRQRALESERPVRFHIFRSGEYLPCWAAALPGTDGRIYMMLTLDVVDWSAIAHVIGKFKHEMRDTVESTLGHINLIERTVQSTDAPGAERISRRIGGFTRLVTIHMSRAERLMNMLERLESIRTGQVRESIQRERTRVVFSDFIEDFLEELDEINLLDPETVIQDYRSRITVHQPDELVLYAAPRYLTFTLRELVRNAIMYSLRGTTIHIKAYVKNQAAQVDVTDEGYGIRQKEWKRVFRPFERARQPQIISEFGYGLGLHLCKHEIEAMNGRMWFTSEENLGTTISFMLPLWRDSGASSSSTSAME